MIQINNDELRLIMNSHFTLLKYFIMAKYFFFELTYYDFVSQNRNEKNILIYLILQNLGVTFLLGDILFI